jgi:SAM-dependent methyltransferase
MKQDHRALGFGALLHWWVVPSIEQPATERLWIDSSPAVASLNYSKGQLLTRLGLRGHYSGSTARALQSQFVEYARQVVDDYAFYGASNRPDPFVGASILEIGPGDNLAVALLMLARGAESVTCADAFSPSVNSAENRRIYRALRKSLTEQEAATLSRAVEIGADGELTVRDGRLKMCRGLPVEALGDALEQRFDVILSRAALEHASDAAQAWKAMCARLKPGGQMWHKIDFRSHNFYNAIHPLYFLTIPERLWRIVSRPDPTLNRERMPFYREALARTFPDAKVFVTRILEHAELLPHVPLEDVEQHIRAADLELIERVRPKLIEGLRGQPAADVLIGGVFVSCRDGRC